MSQILEYKEDLESYYKRGFGNEMNKHVGCPLAKDLLDRFRYGFSITVRVLLQIFLFSVL
jgi:hypothetical protein